MDEALFRFINQGFGSTFIDQFMITITHKETWIAPGLLFLGALLYVDRRKGALAIFLGALAVAIGDPFTYYILKENIGRIRPCMTLEDARALVSCGNSFSFPSNHAVNSFAMAGAIGGLFYRTLYILLPVAALVALSRVAVGAHYPSDVVVGAMLGFAFGWGLACLGKRITGSKAGSGNAGQRAVFLDRDGCVNVENSYIRDIKQFRLYPDTLPALKKLQDAGFKLVVITNQSGVARGFMTEELVNETHELLLKLTADEGVTIDRIEYCPHHPEGAVEKYAIVCGCRKPETGMLDRAAKALRIDFSSSYVMGDKISDIALGPAIGARSVLLRTGFGETHEQKVIAGEAQAPQFIANGIGDAVDWILEDEARINGS